MVLQVAMSDRGWILVDAPPSTTTSTSSPTNNDHATTTTSLLAAKSSLWIFGCILPSLLVGLSSGMLLQEFIRNSKSVETSKKSLQRQLDVTVRAWSQPFQLVWMNQRHVVASVVSQWWWLLLLTCKSTTSWTLGPLAAYCYLSWWGLSDDASDDSSDINKNSKEPNVSAKQQLWNTATSTTATVASSQASAADWDESNHHHSHHHHHHHHHSAGGAAAVSSSKTAPKRYLELLVHNVAHTDMILSLDAPPLSATNDTAASSFCMVDRPAMDSHDNDDDDEQQQVGKSIGKSKRQRHHDASEFCLCRPRFSAFSELSSRVTKAMPNSPTKDMLIDIDRFERMEDADTGGYHIVTPRKSNSSSQGTEEFSTASAATTTAKPIATTTATTSEATLPMTTPLPTGFRLDTSNPHLMIPQEQWSDLRVRGRDAPRVEHCPMAGLPLNAVFFPLLAILLPKWQQQMAQKYRDTNLLPHHVKQVLILVTGVGTPRNSTHNVKGNSTEVLGVLMEQFVKLLYPHITVVRIHSETNLFRYDENINFVEQELMPCIHAYRDAHARGLPYPDEIATQSSSTTTTNTSAAVTTLPLQQPPFDPDWFKSFALTLSFADGSHARTHAIQASLRVSYRPTYFHVWQLKTFWHVGKLVDDDIEVYSFEEMETSPALEPSSAMDPLTKLVWEEMKAFKQEFVDCIKRGGNDIANFWLRKTRQPVLAVLLVQSSSSNDDERHHGNPPKPKLYRGTNMEVSMPTGSLCAERNVIGSALADNPGLKREDLKIIAVLQVPLEEVIVEKSLTAAAAAAAYVMKHSSSFISCSSINAMDADEDWVPTDEQSVNTGNSGIALDPHGGQPALPPVVSFAGTALLSIPPPLVPEQPSTPVRRIQLYPQQGHRSHNNNQQQQHASTTHVKTKPGGGSGDNMMARKLKRTVVVHSAEDKNPLKPCGACNEWLKKIAGSNPYFKILTFTDKECNGIYVRPVQE